MNKDKKREGPPLLYVFSQRKPHEDVVIVSNKTALLQLKDSIEHALENGEGNCTGVFSDYETYDIKIILNDERYDTEFWKRLQLPFFEVDENEGQVLSVEDIIGFNIKNSDDLRNAEPEVDKYRKYNQEMTEKMKQIAKRNMQRNSQMEYIKILDSPDLIKLDEYLSKHEVNEKVNGESLIYWAVFHNNLPFIKRLLEIGADPDQRDSLDRSLLENASYFGFYDVCKTLLESGAKIDDNCFRRAENSWDGFSQSEIIELLHEWQKGNCNP